jgi:hypothetical protein
MNLCRKAARSWLALCLLTLSLPVSAGQATAPIDERFVIVPVANMYSSETEDTDVVSQAILGSHVVVLELQNDWAKVRCRAVLKGRTNSIRCKFRVLKDRKTISSCT